MSKLSPFNFSVPLPLIITAFLSPAQTLPHTDNLKTHPTRSSDRRPKLCKILSFEIVLSYWLSTLLPYVKGLVGFNHRRNIHSKW